MKRLTANQIPKWFKLSKYDDTSKMTLATWLDNLYWRYDLLSMSDERLVAMRKEIDSHFETLETMAFENMRYARGEITYSGELRFDALETGTVNSLRVSYVAHCVADAATGYGELGPRLAKLAEKLNEAELNPVQEDEIIDGETQQLLDLPMDTFDREETHSVDRSSLDPQLVVALENLGGPMSDNVLHVQVDLSAPDKLIVEDFRTWLKVARREYSIESKNFFTESMRDDWSEYGVLPFLDLSLWARANGLEITDAIMGEALFSSRDDVDIVERMRKVVRPKASWLMNPSVLQAIEAQVLRPK